jgi:hypothetical protein
MALEKIGVSTAKITSLRECLESEGVVFSPRPT